jgi:hypothetical protein
MILFSICVHFFRNDEHFLNHERLMISGIFCKKSLFLKFETLFKFGIILKKKKKGKKKTRASSPAHGPAAFVSVNRDLCEPCLCTTSRQFTRFPFHE